MLKKAEMTYVAYFATCLEELADSSKTPEEWATEHTKRNQKKSASGSASKNAQTDLERKKNKDISFPNTLEDAFEKLNKSSGIQQYLRDPNNM